MGRLLQQSNGGRLSKLPKPEELETGFFEDVQQDISKRTEKVEEISDITSQGKQTFAEGALQVAGQAAGGVFDIAGRAISKVTPDIIEKPIIKAISAITKTKTAQEAMDLYKGFKEKNPRIARDLEAGLNLLLALGLPKGVGTTGGGAGAIGRGLEESGKQAVLAERKAFARRLVRPVETTLVKKAEVARITEKGFGPFKKSVVKPTPQEARAQEAILTIPEISPRKTFQQNYNIIKEANIKKAQELEKAILEKDFIYPRKELMSEFNKTKERLVQNPTIVGDAEKISEKLVAEFERRIANTPSKGSSLLKIRKEYDKWVESQKGSAIFDPVKENAFSIANREIRQTVNGFLDKHAKDVGVKKSLQEQSALFNALENIKPKAALEANTAIGRSFQKIGQVLGTKNRIVQIIAATVGIGGLGAAATFAPAAAVVGVGGFLIFRAGKLFLHPGLRIQLGKLLQQYEKATGLTSDDTIKAINEALSYPDLP